MRYRVRHTLKQWRQLAGLTQEQFAEAINRSRITVVRWEQGKTAPNANDIAEIEKVLKIKWSDDIL